MPVPLQQGRGSGRDLDVVVFGATGFVGELTAQYLAAHGSTTVDVGLAGRSAERLAIVRERLGRAAANWPLIVADASDPDSLEALAERARVIATTVGPYGRYGLPLVEACARVGTHYADLTGEVLFVRESIDRFHDIATSSGARIVHACGFDSVPSDLGVHAIFVRAQADGEGDLTDTELVMRSARGGVSGGTIDSLRSQVDALRAAPSLRSIAADPYALSPDRRAEPSFGKQRDSITIGRDHRLGVWTGRFPMASYNTRIVRRSNALLNWAYGRRFRYREVMSFGGGPAAPLMAGAVTAGLGALTAGMAFLPTRKVLDRVLPSPGDGPDEDTRRGGHFRVDIHAQTTTGARYRAVVAADADPGYGATSVMLGEAALSLASDGDRLPERAGILTPATAMNGALVDRLRQAGFRLSVDRL